MIFESRDLQRVRLAGAADPMWELVLALQKTQIPAVPAPLVGWRQEAGRRLGGADAGRHPLWPLDCLVAPRGDFPDFLTPPELVTDLDAGCAAVAATSRDRLDADLEASFRRRTPRPWVRSLADGDRAAVRELVRAVRTGHELLIAPHWVELRDVVAADRARRAREMAEQGVGALLRGLPGVVGWDGRVLYAQYPEERTVSLAGRGLILLPSYFCWGTPVTWIDPELPPVLVYQAHDPAAPHRFDVTLPDALVSLLGRTRAECLRALLKPRSTSELADHLGTSTGNASKQASVLRDAGLVVSSRRGTNVLHHATPLGVALLTGRAPEFSF